jgi:hypothetical protein
MLLAAALAAASGVASGEARAVPVELHSTALGVRFAVPADCGTREGPGTIEAVCDPSGAGRTVEAVSALFFEIVMEETPETAAQPLDLLAQNYSLGQFQKDLPGAVCGTEARIKIEHAMQVFEGGRVAYNAVVQCPEVSFLGLGPRRASVRTIVAPGRRYRVQARALNDDFAQLAPIIDAFFASLRLDPEEKQ